MYIENLRVDQFGHLRDVSADGLQPRLNIIGCLHESVRDSARDFVRWMLFGNETATPLGAPYLGAPPERSFVWSTRGSMFITEGARHRQIQRVCDSSYGRLSIDGRYDDSAREFRGLVGSLTLPEFDAVFAPLLCRDVHPDKLLSAVGVRHLDLTSQRIPNGQLSHLQHQYRQRRDELDQLADDDTLGKLAERRTYLRRRIEELEHQKHLQRHELDRQYHEINQRLAEVSRDVDRLRSEYHLRDEDANRRRAELQEAWRIAQQAKDAFLDQRHREWNELEGRANRWREILHEVRTRLGEVQELRRRLPNIGTHDEKTCLVAGLAENLDRLRRDVGSWTEPATSSVGLGANPRSEASFRSDDPYARPAVEELRREVSRLCQTLQIHRTNNDQNRWLEMEADYLQQCESLISHWLTKLEDQLNVTRHEVAEIGRSDLTLVNDAGGFRVPRIRDPQADWPCEVGYYDPSDIYRGSVRAVSHACDGYDVSPPDADALLCELVDRRNRAQSESDVRQRDLHVLESQRDSIDERRRQIEDYEIQAVRRELAELESRFHLADRRMRLERELARIVDQMRSEREDVRQSLVAEQASRVLGQLTGGRLNRVRIEDGRHLAVDDAQGMSVSLNDCSRELRSDTYLAVCLALVSEYRRRGVQLPLVLNEPFLMTNHGRDSARAAVLRDFADAGHQVIVLTIHGVARELFRAFDFVYVDLQPRPAIRPIASPLPRITEPPIVDEPPAESLPRREFEDQVRFKRRNASTPVDFPSRVGHEPRDLPRVEPPAEESVPPRSVSRPDMPVVAPHHDPIRPRDTQIKSRDISPVSFTDEQHSLSLTSPIDSTQVIDPVVAKWLRENAVTSVRDFLELSSADIIEELTNGGFGAYPVRRWQDELALRCWVVGLAAEDAALLVACGILDAEQLAEMDSDELYDILVRNLKTQTVSNYDTQQLGISPNRVHFWIRAARRSRTDWVRFRTRSFGKRAWSRELDVRRSGSATVQSSRNGSGRSPSDVRSTGSHAQAAAVPSPSDSSIDTELRFFLDGSDPLADAPSIGPRTAGYFRKIGVTTVAEFINLEPESAALQISNRRISVNRIRDWQAQAVLACRVPQLRGHDAQILVACEIKDPTVLARMEPAELWARVKPFMKTAEGKRIVRGGSSPDLEEVQNWIRWAKQSRTLRAA